MIGHHNPAQALRVAFNGMRTRCLNRNHRTFADYGGRGVTIWPEWVKSFACFKRDIEATIGEHPGKGMTLDRIDNNKGYVPGNLRWATKSQQMKNRRRWVVKFWDSTRHPRANGRFVKLSTP